MLLRLLRLLLRPLSKKMQVLWVDLLVLLINCVRRQRELSFRFSIDVVDFQTVGGALMVQ